MDHLHFIRLYSVESSKEFVYISISKFNQAIHENAFIFISYLVSTGICISWPPALSFLSGPDPRPRLLPPNLYLSALAPNLYLLVMPHNLYLLVLTPNLYLPALTPNLCLSQIYITRLNLVWVCIYRPSLPNLCLLALAYDLYAHRLLSWFTHNDAE